MNEWLNIYLVVFLNIYVLIPVDSCLMSRSSLWILLFLCLKDCILLYLFIYFWLRFNFIYDLTSSCMLIFYLSLFPNQKPLLTYLTLFFFFWCYNFACLCPYLSFPKTQYAELEGCAIKLVTWSYSLFVADKSREWRDYWIFQENVKMGNVTSLSILVPRTYLSNRIFNHIGYTFLCGRFS